MIFDTLNQSSRYHALSPRLAKAFEFLENMTDDVAVKRHDIDGDNVYALVQGYDTTPVETRQYEVHRQYLDVQYIHRGHELIYWKPLAELTDETMAYSDEHDAQLFAYQPAGVPFAIGPGQFTILYPTDGHIPCCSIEGASPVLKVVVKVRID